MERKEQTGHICRWMALGIMTAIVIVGCTIVIGLFEWRDRKEIECRNAELHQWRKNVHDLNLHITELSLLGEMVADWDSTDVNEYHSLRLEVDSMLEGIAGICPKEDSDTICRLLAEKEQLLLDIKDAMQELNATQEKLTAEVPRIVEQNKTESKRLSAMPQQAKPKKRGFFSRLFGKKENAVITGNRLTQTEKMLTNLNQTVVAKHHQQSRKVVEILDSLGNRNEGINKQLQRVISIADENVDKGIKVRERQIADLEGNYTYYYIGMIGLLILVFFVLFLLVWRFAFKTRKSKEETRKVMLTVTHEMRSPLSAIKDYARKISGLEDATDESKRYADLIVDTSKGLTSMIDSFLVYSKLANGKATVKERPFRMMDIAEQLKMEYEPFAAKKLDIFGQGEWREMLQQMIDKAELQDSVRLNRPTKQIGEEYVKSDMLVMSSNYEGFPMVMIEAMACGLPVVSFDYKCGPKDIIQPGINGLLVPNGDIQALADAMMKVMEDEAYRKMLSLNARKVVDTYSEQAVMSQWIRLFTSITAK